MKRILKGKSRPQADCPFRLQPPRRVGSRAEYTYFSPPFCLAHKRLSFQCRPISLHLTSRNCAFSEFEQEIAHRGLILNLDSKRIGAEVSRAEVLGTIRARYQLLWVPQGAERGHPFPLIPISYELPLGCHGRGRGFEPRRPRHKPIRISGSWQQKVSVQVRGKAVPERMSADHFARYVCTSHRWPNDLLEHCNPVTTVVLRSIERMETRNLHPD